MGSAAAGKPPSREFIRLYHLNRPDHATSNIQNKRLKIARFEDLNDPFEFRALEFRDRTVRTIVKNFGTQFGLSTGLLCFSEDWTSPVMWSHYAEGHRGICLGFDVRRSAVRRVLYKSKRLQAALTDSDDPFTLSPAMQRVLVRTKCREWAYERERRMLVPLKVAVEDNGLLFRPFDDTLRLREVIVGPKYETPLEGLLEKTARHPDVCVFKSRLAWNHFKVVPVESSVP